MESLPIIFAKELSGYQPDLTSLRIALGHVPSHMLSGFTDADPWRHNNALGYLYQSVMYDQVDGICDRTPSVGSFVKQFGDVPNNLRSKGSPGQDGFFYSTEGQVVVRGDGFDQGEFDGLVFGSDGSLLLLEMVISKLGLRDIVREVDLKRSQLRRILSKEAEYLLVTPLEADSHPLVKELLRDPRNRLARTKYLTDIPDDLASNARLQRPPHSCKGVFLSQLTTRPFDTADAHSKLKESFLKSVESGTGLPGNAEEFRPVKQLILGFLDREAVDYILTVKGLVVGHPVTAGEFNGRCSRMVLVLTWPELRPKLYLRPKSTFPKWGPNYLKLGPWPGGCFGFERNIFRKRTAFYSHLDAATSALGKRQVEMILERYLRPEVIRKAKKIGEMPVW